MITRDEEGEGLDPVPPESLALPLESGFSSSASSGKAIPTFFFFPRLPLLAFRLPGVGGTSPSPSPSRSLSSPSSAAAPLSTGWPLITGRAGGEERGGDPWWGTGTVTVSDSVKSWVEEVGSFSVLAGVTPTDLTTSSSERAAENF